MFGGQLVGHATSDHMQQYTSRKENQMLTCHLIWVLFPSNKRMTNSNSFLQTDERSRQAEERQSETGYEETGEIEITRRYFFSLVTTLKVSSRRF